MGFERTIGRRHYLTALGAASISAVAGCTSASGYDDAADAAGSGTDWPEFGHDKANTNYSPQGSAPTNGVSERWRIESFGLTTQPIVADNTVYAVTGADMLAIDAESGETRWSVAPDNRAGYFWASPVVRDGTVYLGDGHGQVRAFDAANGDVRWETTFERGVYGSPTVGPEGRGLFVGTSSGRICRLNRESGEIEWSREVFGQVHSGMAIRLPFVYAVTEGGELYALSTDTGQGYWRTELPDSVRCSPSVVAGSVYLGCMDGKVYAINGGRGGIEWSTSVGGFVQSGVAVADGTVYTDGGRDLQALDAENGEKQWHAPVSSANDHTPVVVGNTVYSGGDSLYAFKRGGGVGVGGFRVEPTRFAESYPRGVGPIAPANGDLYCSVRTGEQEYHVVALEET